MAIFVCTPSFAAVHVPRCQTPATETVRIDADDVARLENLTVRLRGMAQDHAFP